MKISDGFKFEIGQFLARITISAVIFGSIAILFLLATFLNMFFEG